MKQTILIFGGLSIAILILFQISKLSLLHFQGDNDFFIVVLGVLFIAIGFVLNRFLHKKDKARATIQAIDEDQLKKTNLSKQEYKILTLMAQGLSNMEIAEDLFISENTVKTHVSKILLKLNAKRRTQAIRIGRELNII
ncbi:response regulator transcription factor [Fulvivirgaceae bacterium BMA12]|uniref:Response regulator transcription factor n=1 Tax=Agaribacillus aureus TaxID=3051825 RepID=A0ABT8LDE2_9BACT|nr:response regulator transcription factor [Fulvivirgaceae bacterium BMA12]